MKKLSLTYVLLAFMIICNAQSQESYKRIGYTTTYGNTFQIHTTNNNFQSVNIHKNNPIIQNTNYNSISYKYSPLYKPALTNTKPRIAKSPQRPYSGDSFEDLIDWLRINTDPNWPSYVDNDYWDEFLTKYPEYEDEVREWFKNNGKKFPGDPEDPFAQSIGDNIFLYLICILYGYYIYKRKPRRVSL